MFKTVSSAVNLLKDIKIGVVNFPEMTDATVKYFKEYCKCCFYGYFITLTTRQLEL